MIKNDLFDLLDKNSNVIEIKTRDLNPDYNDYTTDIILEFDSEAIQHKKTFAILGNNKTAVIQTLRGRFKEISTEDGRSKFSKRVDDALIKYNKWLNEYREIN